METVFSNLEEQGYSCDASLSHQELIPFVKTYLFKRNGLTLSFLFLNIAFLFLLIIITVFHISNYNISLSTSLLWVAYGCAVTFLLIPLHELLHGLAYRCCGAKNVSYKANWRKLYFMATADKFITNRQSFYFIGLTPFIIISLCLLFLLFVSPSHLQIMWLTVLLVHASMCAGDFGLLSYFAENKNREVVTFDDDLNGISYFYSRKL